MENATEQNWRRYTVPEIFLEATARYGKREALREKQGDEWQTLSWAAYAQEVTSASLGLAALGLKKGECVSILSENCPHWIYADMAIMCAGGVSAGIYPTSAPAQIEYFLTDCSARYIFASNQAQLDKLLAIREKLPQLRKIITLNEDVVIPDNALDVLTFDALKKTGAQIEKDNKFNSMVKSVSPDDVAILIYTSGTTGAPKGVMLTHRNIMFEIAVHDKFLHIAEGDDLISFLPLSHIAERMLTSLRPMMHGARVTFSQGPEKLATEIMEVSPHVFFAVPRIWEKFHAAINSAIEKASPFQRWSYRCALSIGRRAAQHKYSARRPPSFLMGIQKITDMLVMRNIRAKIGMGRAHFVICGAAPVSPDLLLWMAAIGLDVRETYGLTENGSVAAIAPLDQRKLGSVGKAVLDSEIKIAPDAEILIKGDHVFAGYFNKEEETRQTLKDGWLYTGDLGRFDGDGFLFITGRKKDIIITSGGKNISPAQIENELKFHPLITDCMVVGDGQKYLTCLIMLDPINAREYAGKEKLAFASFAELSRRPEIYEIISDEIARINQLFSRVEQIKTFRILDVPLALDDGMLTPTMKLKRDAVANGYEDVINEMYAEAAPNDRQPRSQTGRRSA